MDFRTGGWLRTVVCVANGLRSCGRSRTADSTSSKATTATIAPATTMTRLISRPERQISVMALLRRVSRQIRASTPGATQNAVRDSGILRDSGAVWRVAGRRGKRLGQALASDSPALAGARPCRVPAVSGDPGDHPADAVDPLRRLPAGKESCADAAAARREPGFPGPPPNSGLAANPSMS